MYKLVIEDDEGKTTVVPLIREEITIGRKEGNTIRLTERNVSRRHAKISKDDEQVHIEDVASRYGTKHNGEKIKETVRFKEGDVVMIGDYRLSLQADKAVAKPPPKVTTPDTSKANEHTQQVQAIDLEDIPIDEAGRLVVVSSNYAGREFPLVQAEMVIGRTEGDIRIDHRSISRNHAKIVRDGDRYKIIDLRSSNGVRVNNEEYRSVHLKRGDMIELGHVRFRYVAPGETYHFKPDTSAPMDMGPSPTGGGGGMGKILLGVGALIAVVLLLGVVGIVALGFGSGDKAGDGDKGTKKGAIAKKDGAGEKKAPEADKKVPEDPEVANLIGKANTAIDEEEWDKAVTLLDLALEKQPTNKDAATKKSMALKEKPMKGFYKAGKDALSKDDYQGAMENFDKIPEDLSVYYKRIKDEGLYDKAVGGIVEAYLSDARALYRSRNYADANEALKSLLKYDSDNRDAKALQKQVLAAYEKAKATANNNTPPGPNGIDNKPPDKGVDKGSNKPPGPTGPKISAAEKRAKGKELIKEAIRANATGNPGLAIQKAQEAAKYGVSNPMLMAQSYEKLGNNASAIRYYNAWLRGNQSSKQADRIRNKIRVLGGTPVN